MLNRCLYAGRKEKRCLYEVCSEITQRTLPRIMKFEQLAQYGFKKMISWH